MELFNVLYINMCKKILILYLENKLYIKIKEDIKHKLYKSYIMHIIQLLQY